MRLRLKLSPSVALKSQLFISCLFDGGSGEGRRYVRHRDAFPATIPDEAIRVVTMVYYLNDGWQPSNGGQLRVFYGRPFYQKMMPAFCIGMDVDHVW